jgi:hypothetical protein
MTPAQILASIRSQIDEATANFYTDNEIYAYMWQAECTINNEVECAESTDTSITTVNGTAEYTKPTDMIFAKRVWWYLMRMQKIDFRMLENQEGLSYGSTIQTGQPYAYYEYADKIGFYPTPNAAQAVKIWYIKQPVVLTSSSTAFTIPQLFHHLIPDYCLWRMWAKDQEENRAADHQNRWNLNLQIAKQSWAKYKNSDAIIVVKDGDRYPNTYAGMV